MPEFTTYEKNGRIRQLIKLQPGERVSLCRCYASQTFPFCDGSHKLTHSNIGPVVVEVSEEKNNPPETE